MADSLDAKHGTSDEFIDPYCDICYEDKHFVRPEGYCHDCYQCLCKNCLFFHRRFLGTRDHVIRSGEDIPKSQADKPPRFEYCDVHHNHYKDQYCKEHRVLLCKLCVPLHHQNCPVESVECAAKSISSSEIDLFYDTVSNFKTQLLSAESRMKSNIEDLKRQKNKILKEIQETYDKTKSKLDKLFQDTKSDLESKYQTQFSVLSRDQKNIKDVTDSLNSTLSDIKTLKGKTVETKAFLKIQDLMKSIDKYKMDVSTLKQTIARKMLNFVSDKTMNNFLSTSFTMGTISLQDCSPDVTISVPEILFPVSPSKLTQASAAGYHPSRSRKPISEMKAQKCSKYDIILRDDKKGCFITDLAVTLDGRRLLVDYGNKKIKLFSRDMKIITSLTLPAVPRRIAVTGDREAVVSVLGMSQLYILDVSDQQLSVRRIVELSFGVVAIATCRDRLVVTSLDPSPPSVKLIDQRGKVYWSTSTGQQGQLLFSVPDYVSCYDDGRSSTVIVTDSSNSTLTLLNSDTGDVISRRQVGRKGPQGVTTDTAGNIFVCYLRTSELAVLAKDFSVEKILLTQRDGVSEPPIAIVYDAEDHQLLVAYFWQSSRCNVVESFQLL